MNLETKRLYRSRKERMIGGVCAGLGEFFGIDPTVVRLVFVLSLFLWPGPFAVIAYLILLVVVPEEPLPGNTIVDVAPQPPVSGEENL